MANDNEVTPSASGQCRCEREGCQLPWGAHSFEAETRRHRPNECGFCDKGVVCFGDDDVTTPCLHCDGTGYVQEVGRGV